MLRENEFFFFDAGQNGIFFPQRKAIIGRNKKNIRQPFGAVDRVGTARNALVLVKRAGFEVLRRVGIVADNREERNVDQKRGNALKNMVSVSATKQKVFFVDSGIPPHEFQVEFMLDVLQ
jgi:hypothetical protein